MRESIGILEQGGPYWIFLCASHTFKATSWNNKKNAPIIRNQIKKSGSI
ncbi:hypothetical protein J5TS2_11600 [Brevibacillus halotolerans]|nr:hypothetical protein J5TS2_11600 [Brevibacillus halotolerans]